MLSLEEFSKIPDDVVEDMLDAAGKVVVAAQQSKIRSLGLVESGRLLSSVRAFPKAGNRRNGWNRYVLVYPYGKHGDRKRRAVTKTYKSSKSGRQYTVGGDIVDVTNNEVGFIHEFGAPKRGIPAKQWMRAANEECAEAVSAAEFAVYEKWLKSINL